MRKRFFLNMVFVSSLICSCSNLAAQTIFSENFEGTFPPAGWGLANIGGSGWSQNVVSAVSGTKSIKCNGNINSASNAWAFTPAISLTANNRYRISYWYRTATTAEYMKLTIGTQQTIASQVTVVHNYTGITNTTFREGVDTVNASSTGSYYLGFNYYSGLGGGVVVIDSVVISKLIPSACTGIPFIGVASAPDIVSNGGNFSLNLSGDYSLFLGLQFQWQLSSPGTNNFQNITGATTQNYQTSQNVGKDYRCKITCPNNSSTAYSNTIHVSLPQEGYLFREKYIGDVALTKHVYDMSFINPATGFVAFSDAVGFTQDSGNTFIRRQVNINNMDYNGFSNVNLTFGFSFRGVHTLSQDSLLVYGDYGAGPAIIFSANQGITWKLVFHQPFALNPDIGNSFFDMKFLSVTEAIAINQKYIVETVNRGQTWTVKAQIPSYRSSNFAKLSVPSATTGYAVAGDYLWRRNGTTWSESFNSLPDNTGLNYNNISFTSNTNGYITKDNNGAVYRTVNGGNNWIRVNDTTLSPVYATDMHFTNDSTGFISSATGGYIVSKTTDYGKTWENCKRNSTYQYGVYGIGRLFFLNNQTGWAGGRGEYLMLTTSAGNPTIPKSIFKIDTTNLTPTGTVNLLNLSKTYYQYKWYRNGVLISTSYNASYTHEVYFIRDTIQLIVDNGIDSDTLIQYQDFTYTQAPVITGFTPTSAGENTVVTITGYGFINATAVNFGNAPAATYTVNSYTMITATVGGGLSGNLSVTTANGTGTAGTFTFVSLPAPIVNSISPESGNVGTTVTITGNNFSPLVNGNIIYFGKVKAVITSASATQLICKVPTGSSFDAVTVVNLVNKKSGSSARRFNVTFAGGTATPNSFYQTLKITTDPIISFDIWPLFVTAGDFDGDGKNDMLGSVRYYTVADSLFIYRNITSSDIMAFGPRKAIGIGNVAAIADIDADGKLDIIFINATNGNIGIARNISTPGSITFENPLFFPAASGNRSLSVKDIDDDGRPEILVAGYNDGVLGILQNTSTSTVISFAPLLSFTSKPNPRAIEVGDVDQDGKADIIISGSSPSSISVFRNISSVGNISLASRMDMLTAGSVVKAFVADVNNDGKPDIVVTNEAINTAFSVFKNNGTTGALNFSARQDFNTAQFETPITGELNNMTGDNLPDYFTGNYYTGSCYFHSNISSASAAGFALTTLYGQFGDAQSCAASDIDGDGKPEILYVTAFGGNRGFYFFRNRVGEPVVSNICSNTSFTTNISGAAYQWQLDSGTGFNSIFDNINYSGTASATLTITGALTSWAGYKFRCMVIGSYSDEFKLKFQNSWMGTVSSAWENPANWSCGKVPDQNTDVIINTGTVLISSNGFINSLVTQQGASITVNPGFNLTILH